MTDEDPLRDLDGRSGLLNKKKTALDGDQVPVRAKADSLQLVAIRISNRTEVDQGAVEASRENRDRPPTAKLLQAGVGNMRFAEYTMTWSRDGSARRLA